MGKSRPTNVDEYIAAAPVRCAEEVVGNPFHPEGSGFADVAYQFKVTAVMAVVFNTLAVVSYRKQE